MAVIRITRPPMVTSETYDAVNDEIGVDQQPPAGLILHTAGEVDGQWQIIDVWASEEDAQRFDRERLGPAVAKVMGSAPPGQPPSTSYELHRLIQP